MSKGLAEAEWEPTSIGYLRPCTIAHVIILVSVVPRMYFLPLWTQKNLPLSGSMPVALLSSDDHL